MALGQLVGWQIANRRQFTPPNFLFAFSLPRLGRSLGSLRSDSPPLLRCHSLQAGLPTSPANLGKVLGNEGFHHSPQL